MKYIYKIIYLLFYPYLYYKLIYKKEKVILIYQMGKVGSASVYSTLKKNYYNCVHVHYLLPSNIDNLISEKSKTIKFNLFPIVGRFVYNNIILKKKDVYIITIIRNPIERNISAFFQNILKFEGVNYKLIEMEQLKQDFLNNYNHEIPLAWFDKEFYPTTGINIYDYDFDKSKGYLIMESNNIKLLIYKLELDDRNKEIILAKFLNSNKSRIKLEKTNLSTNKGYSDIYKKFKNNSIYSDEMITKIKQSKFYKKFY